MSSNRIIGLHQRETWRQQVTQIDSNETCGHKDPKGGSDAGQREGGLITVARSSVPIVRQTSPICRRLFHPPRSKPLRPKGNLENFSLYFSNIVEILSAWRKIPQQPPLNPATSLNFASPSVLGVSTALATVRTNRHRHSGRHSSGAPSHRTNQARPLGAWGKHLPSL